MLIKKALLPSAVFASLRSLNSIEEPRPRLSASVFSPAWATICFFSASKMFLMQCESNSFLSPEDTQWSRRFRIQVVNDTLYHTNGSVSLHNDSMTLTGVSVTRMIAWNLTYMRRMSRMISLSRLLSSKVSKVLKSVTYLTHAIWEHPKKKIIFADSFARQVHFHEKSADFWSTLTIHQK